VLASSRTFMEIEMAIFDRRHFDVRVLINHTRADIVTEKHLGYRYCAATVGNPDLGADTEILHSRLDQLFRSGRAIDMDRLGAILIPRDRQQCTETGCVIVVMVGDKDNSDFANVDTSFY
jgi:hypothetical protein